MAFVNLSITSVMICKMNFMNKSSASYPEYIQVRSYDNTKLSIVRDQANKYYTVSWSPYKAEPCCICNSPQATFFTYVSSLTVQNWINDITGDVQSFFDVVTKRSILPIVNLCSGCAINVELRLAKLSVETLDNMVDTIREENDIVKENASVAQKITEQPQEKQMDTSGLRDISILMFAVRLNSLFDFVINDTKSKYEMRNGMVHYLTQKIMSFMGI